MQIKFCLMILPGSSARIALSIVSRSILLPLFLCLMGLQDPAVTLKSESSDMRSDQGQNLQKAL